LETFHNNRFSSAQQNTKLWLISECRGLINKNINNLIVTFSSISHFSTKNSNQMQGTIYFISFTIIPRLLTTFHKIKLAEFDSFFFSQVFGLLPHQKKQAGLMAKPLPFLPKSHQVSTDLSVAQVQTAISFALLLFSSTFLGPKRALFMTLGSKDPESQSPS